MPTFEMYILFGCLLPPFDSLSSVTNPWISQAPLQYWHWRVYVWQPLTTYGISSVHFFCAILYAIFLCYSEQECTCTSVIDTTKRRIAMKDPLLNIKARITLPQTDYCLLLLARQLKCYKSKSQNGVVDCIWLVCWKVLLTLPKIYW